MGQNSSSVAKVALQFDPGGCRPRGKPMRVWIASMTKDMRVADLRPEDVNVTLLLNMGPEPPPSPPPPPSIPLYPKNATLLRHAQYAVRVVQPSQGPHLTRMYSRLAEASPIFGITSTAGIVYVQNKTALLEAPQYIQLEIEWQYNRSEPWQRVNVTVVVEEGTAPVCQHDKVTKAASCSIRGDKTHCMNLCGIGTGKGNFTSHGLRGNISDTTETGGCAWREPKEYRSDVLTKQYSTCTPDLETCPDDACDPLEDLFPALCPQDCIQNDKAFGMPTSKGRGLSKGHGVCTCDRITCSCDERVITNKLMTAVPSTPTTPESSGPSTKKADLRGSCGAECKLGVVVGSLLLIGSTIGFIFWRYRLAGKGRRDRKFMGSVASLSVVQSDYVDRTLQTTDVQGLTSPRASPDPRTTPDPKWEFPRSRLVIEQTLGEGEFGRVLRARAMDIGGTTGYTTVAVKTLKEDASASELADLLSEYQLLKEVSHPNVVRLLGACTAPGAPVYLIIEFAEHGSLRNYLRKSRHLESDGQIPCSFEPTAHPEDMPPAPSPATPRDILCFAWQISKGMAYLSDIKLVHRDLAARNVLVGAGKVCKISDFGLTRDVYEDDAYLKRSKGRVPVKWMALESLADHMYTSKSDVWSFGVLMWELVTLGASPYPGVAVHNLFHLLRAGYRMERPENCSSQLYRVMRSCWNEDASDRPSFKELTRIFERMLEDGVEYLDLNPRIVHNRTYFTSLSSSQDILDDDDLGYGNLNILPTDSVNYLTHHQRQLQSSSSRMPLLSTGDEEQRLLMPPVDINKISSQTDSEKQEESPRVGNAYLSPIRQPSSLNRISNDSSVVNPSTASLSQSYINMTVGQPKRGSSQDLLVSTSPVTSKVTTPF
ncbi:proto-oncogene tyrosine-protein kinase receptor Ret [Anabrus simplex]|uniref:proto-oncogene tyrosine-protein kinase receptor Ret n=1 Tax=Anabrus simplex TaxID=316456 RepID=UPI0035A2EA80